MRKHQAGEKDVVFVDLEAGSMERKPAEKEAPSRYKSEAMRFAHALAADLYAGDKRTMDRFDRLCLTPIEPMAADAIRTLREASGVSQAVMAAYLNVTTSTVSQWERGQKAPTGSALKLLALAKKNGLASIM
ncbi:DNA-binding transcriptional regulator [soil metagenome]